MIAIIPARSGSSLPDKNLREVGGEPLLKLAIEFARANSIYPVVTTDSYLYVQLAKEWCETVLLREIHGPDTRMVDVWADAWEVSETKLQGHGDISVYLEPTSPLRTSEDFRRCISALDDDWYLAAATVSPAPYKQKLFEIGYESRRKVCTGNSQELVNRPRQGLTRSWQRNGAVYAARRSQIMDSNSVMESRCCPVVSHGLRPNIDSEDDLLIANLLWERQHKSL